MEWDNRKIAHQFLQKANGLHPEEARGEGKYDETLAHQELFYECYMSCFSLGKLNEMLERACGGDIKLPEEAEDEAKYRKAYTQMALKISEVVQTKGGQANFLTL